LAGLGRRPFWFDELITVQRAALPLPALLQSALVEHHTPVYFPLAAPFARSQDPQFWLRCHRRFWARSE